MNLSPRTELIIAYERMAEEAKSYIGLDQRWAVREDLLTAVRDAIQALPPDLSNPMPAKGTTMVIETKREGVHEDIISAIAATWPYPEQPEISVYVPAEEGDDEHSRAGR